MVNLRMIGLASALFLLLPAGVAANTLLESTAEAGAEVTDVVIAELNGQDRDYDETSFRVGEQLVEGHTVLAVIDLASTAAPAQNGTIDVLGSARCEHEVNATGPVWSSPFGDIVVPNRIERARVYCEVGETVVVTPDPFSTSSRGPLTPTGRAIAFRSPGGAVGEAVEYAFDATVANPDGTLDIRRGHLWTVPVVEPFLCPDGRVRNVVAPLPLDVLLREGYTSFRLDVAQSP